MKVTMRARLSGTRNGEDWPADGESIDLPDDEAVQLLNQGMAVPADEAKAERATAKPGK